MICLIAVLKERENFTIAVIAGARPAISQNDRSPLLLGRLRIKSAMTPMGKDQYPTRGPGSEPVAFLNVQVNHITRNVGHIHNKALQKTLQR